MSTEQPYEELARLALEAFRTRHTKMGTLGGLRAGPPARVARLDRDEAYLLIPIFDGIGLRGIVQLDEVHKLVESSAVVRDPASEFLLDVRAAQFAASQALPQAHGWGRPSLGWRPCRESFSSLSPLWVVPHATGTAYVTQSGAVSETLSEGRGG